MRGATQLLGAIGGLVLVFQPTRPLRGATQPGAEQGHLLRISTHAPLAGRDECRREITGGQSRFQPTRPLRGATAGRQDRAQGRLQFQPTRPLRGATIVFPPLSQTGGISTHAPLAGRDGRNLRCRHPSRYFNPRAPCGARPTPPSSGGRSSAFQPTRPLRGATARAARKTSRQKNFNPRAPCGARPHRKPRPERHLHFNPRAPCGARPTSGLRTPPTPIFQPTRPLRGATLVYGLLANGFTEFQPTRPLRGATVLRGEHDAAVLISTHAPLAGRDGSASRHRHTEHISTHAPLAGRDSKSVQINMHIFAITDKFQMLLHRMPPVRAFCSFLMQENHADLGANRPSDLCALVLRTIRSSVPRADTSACSRSVRFYSRTSCPSSKIEGCPFLGQ